MVIKSLYKNLRLIITLVFVLFCATFLLAQNYSGNPLTKPKLIFAVKSKQYSTPNLVRLIKESGVDFKVTPQVEEELLDIKTNPRIIAAAKQNYRAPAIARTSVNPTTKTSRAVNTTAGNSQAPVNNPAGQNPDEEYERLYHQGLQVLEQLRAATTQQQAFSLAQTLKDTGNRAIRLNPTRAEAYKLVGSALLLTGNFNEAERYGQMALDRGGSLAFPVYHLAGTPHPEHLHIGKGYITVESDQKFFEFNSREVYNLQLQPAYNAGGRSVAVFSISTYKNNAPYEWYFSPANTYLAEEANLIIRLIRANINKY